MLGPDVLTTTYDSLDKGDNYEARVRGQNVRGPGLFSDYERIETLIDGKLIKMSSS